MNDVCEEAYQRDRAWRRECERNSLMIIWLSVPVWTVIFSLSTGVLAKACDINFWLGVRFGVIPWAIVSLFAATVRTRLWNTARRF